MDPDLIEFCGLRIASFGVLLALAFRSGVIFRDPDHVDRPDRRDSRISGTR